jgi:FKBP-type peptidyl-prolyl cis-trans isomerase FklB
MKNTVYIALFASLFAASCGVKSTKETELTTEIDSVSYMIGLTYGRNLITSGVEDFNFDAMMKGLEEGFRDSGGIDAQTVRFYLMNFFEKLDQKEADSNEAEGLAWLQKNKEEEGVIEAPEGFQYKVIKMGTGEKPGEHDTVEVHYTGKLIDGSVFDSSVEGGTPAVFPVDRVIQGWTFALQQMPVGSKWILYIPSSLAYGQSKGPGGDLPPNSTLIFEVELLSLTRASGGE